MQPAHGARMTLRLRESSPEVVRYAVELEIASGESSTDAEVRLSDGGVCFGHWTPSEPPSWAVEQLGALLRAHWRARRAADSEPWPRRITRWRDERAPEAP